MANVELRACKFQSKSPIIYLFWPLNFYLSSLSWLLKHFTEISLLGQVAGPKTSFECGREDELMPWHIYAHPTSHTGDRKTEKSVGTDF